MTPIAAGADRGARRGQQLVHATDTQRQRGGIALLIEAGAILASSLDLPTTMAQVAG